MPVRSGLQPKNLVSEPPHEKCPVVSPELDEGPFVKLRRGPSKRRSVEIIAGGCVLVKQDARQVRVGAKCYKNWLSGATFPS
ncbi:MAG: hypothetical protein MAG451_01957 [Anaerolineales bacterium]|nr:hypothetical protein [Anaerolineales bacterium]